MSVKRAVDGRRGFSHGGCGVGGFAATHASSWRASRLRSWGYGGVVGLQPGVPPIAREPTQAPDDQLTRRGFYYHYY